MEALLVALESLGGLVGVAHDEINKIAKVKDRAFILIPLW
jgi:hypothetical protein